VAGYSNKEIAEYFKINQDTAKHHLSNIYEKFGVSTRLELALRIIGPDDTEEAGIIKKPQSPNLNGGSAAASFGDQFE
jgi:hypothetical protein